MIKFVKVVKEENREPSLILDKHRVDESGIVELVKNQTLVPSPASDSAPKKDRVPTLTPISAAVEQRERKDNSPLDIAPPTFTKVLDKDDDSVETVHATQPKRKPGRPPGSGKGAVPKKATVSAITSLSRQIEGLHAMADVVIPGMAIPTPQADLLAEAMQGVIEAYDMKPNPKITSLLTLAGVVGIVEIPKVPIMLEFMRSKNVKQLAIKKAQQMTKGEVPMGAHVPTQSNSTPPIAEDNSGGIFSHVTSEIAEGNPNE